MSVNTTFDQWHLWNHFFQKQIRFLNTQLHLIKKINNTLAFPPHLNAEMAEEASHTSPSQTSYAVSVLNTFETICLVISGLYGSGWHTNMLWHESRIWYGEKDYDYAMIWKQLSYGEAMPVVLHLHGVMSYNFVFKFLNHHNEVIMNSMASQITSLTIVYSTVYSGADQRKHQSSASLAFVRGIHRWPVNSPHKGPVTRKMFPFYDVIMINVNARRRLCFQLRWC